MFTQSLLATLLSWFGIVGGALTVVGNLQTAFSLSNWAKWLATHWQSWMMTFWGGYLGLSHVTADTGFIRVDAPFIFSLALIALGSHFTQGSDPEVPIRRKLLSLIAGSAVLAAWYAVMIYLGQHGVEIDIWFFFVMDWLVIFLMISHWPYQFALLSASAAIILLVLMIIANNGLAEGTIYELAAEVALMVILGAFVIFVARPSAFTRQLLFVLFLIGVILAVSEMSKLGISLEPPRA